MFGHVPIPTAVVPMLRHYTSLYEQNPNPAVDIHAFPFEYNEFMTSRVDTIQGNRWWDPLLGAFLCLLSRARAGLLTTMPQRVTLRRTHHRKVRALPSGYCMCEDY